MNTYGKMVVADGVSPLVKLLNDSKGAAIGEVIATVDVRQPDHARRVAACWNACQNIETEALEGHALGVIAAKSSQRMHNLSALVLVGARVIECAKRLVEHADFQLGGVLSADSKAKEIPSNAVSKVKSRHLAALRDAIAAAPQPLTEAQQFRRFIEWAGNYGCDTAYTCDSDRGKFIALNPMTADLWSAWCASRETVGNHG